MSGLKRFGGGLFDFDSKGSSINWGRCFVLFALLSAVGTSLAADTPNASIGHKTLPQDHPCQQVIRKYMDTLTEQDFAHGVTNRLDERAACDQDPEYLYRNHLYTLMRQPLVGSKDSVPAIQAPPAGFLLSNIERTNAIYLPPVWPETLMSFVQWDYPGNPYRDSRALKLRAFVGAVVQMTMFLNAHEKNGRQAPPPIRTHLHGYHPVIWAAPYPGFKDALPPEVQRAYEACLKLAGERILAYPARGDTCETDLLGPLGLVYISRALSDAEFTRKVEAYVRPIFTDARFFHPAGYWDERGGIDTGFGGMANLYAAWIALMTDWPFAKEVLERVYRLRGHLILPEPDGTLTGPSHFNSRLGSPASKDQWDYCRDIAASMLTDEAAWVIKTPTTEQLTKAPAARARKFNMEHLRVVAKPHPDFYTEEDLAGAKGRPWTLRIWMTYRFPISVNPSYEFYRPGALAHRQELEQADSPLLKSPFLRGETFVRAFEKDFVVTRQPGFAAIVHSGPVGVQAPDDKKTPFSGRMGLGGGQLSAFWTPQAGPVILGLRSGTSLDKSYDVLDAWRTWPIHAISGATSDGKVFTSARIARPEVVTDVTSDGATVKVGGPLVAMKIPRMYDDALEGVIDYTRTFTIDNKGVHVETKVNGDGKDNLAELYETLPVYLGTGQDQKLHANVRIDFQTGGQWGLATEQLASVKAIRITRFGGGVTVTFDTPRRVKLAPADWTDNWLNKYAACRNVMIDLLDGADMAVSSQGERAVRYRIAPSSK